MNITCIPETNYLDTPEFLSAALHINTVLSTPIYVFGLYIILTKTPEQMRKVKWYLVNVHAWIAIFDYTIGILTMPFLLVPVIAGYALGILERFGVPTIFQAVLGFMVCGCMAASIVILFENRFYRVCSVRIKRYWRKIRIKLISLHYIIVIGMLIPYFFLAPDQESAVQRIFQTFPCLPHYVYKAPIYVLTENNFYHLSVIVAYLVICGIEVFTIIGYVGYNTIQQMKSRTLSDKTFQMQKTFFIALVVQISIPLILVIAPVVSWFVMILGFWYHQWITNLGIVMLTTHGWVATLAMMVAHRPYRESILAMIREMCASSVENSRRAMYRNAVSDVQN